MKIVRNNGDNQRAYLITTDKNEIVLVNSDGVVVASSSVDIIGNRIVMQSYPKGTTNIIKNRESHISVIDESSSKNIPTKDNNILFELFLSKELTDFEYKRGSTDQFVNRLIRQDRLTKEIVAQLENDAQVLGYNLEAARSAIVIELVDFYKDLLSNEFGDNKEKIIDLWKTKIINSLTSFFTQNHDMIVAYLGKDRFVVFKCLGKCSEQKYFSLLKSAHKSILRPLINNGSIADVIIGIGNVYNGITGLYDSCKEAETALNIGKIFFSHKKCILFEDLGMLSILADGDKKRKAKFADKLLSRLDNYSNLQTTLEVFFENNLNITTTAEKIGIHRNTVIYRLDQLTKHIGLDPRLFDNAVTIKIALMIRSIQPSAKHYRAQQKNYLTQSAR